MSATPPPGAEAEATWYARLPSFEHVVMNIAFVVLLAAVSWGVASRYVVVSPATWVEEVTSIAFAWLIFVGAAELHRQGRHVSVDLITAQMPRPVQVALAAAIELLVVAYCFYASWLGLQQTIASHSSATSMLRIPLSVAYAGLTLGFLLMALRGIQRLLTARFKIGRFDTGRKL